LAATALPANISKLFATPAHNFRRNRQMNNPIQNKPEELELKYENFFASTENADTNERISTSTKDRDTMLSMIVLLLACLALAALAHVFV
jgi:hypothetical protein